MGHETDNGENDEPSEHAGEGIDAAHNDGVSVERAQQESLLLKLILICYFYLFP